MQITRPDTSGLARSDNPIFVGDAALQTIVDDKASPMLRVSAVTFRDGARNRWHTHGADQVLVVTEGLGVIADDGGEHLLEPGDVVHISAGERHWHGAREGETMTHLSILTPGELTITD